MENNVKLTEKEIILNPGYLKLELITKGARLDHSALEDKELTRALRITSEAGIPLELNLILQDNVLVNIPIQECLNKETPYILKKSEGHFYIYANSSRVKVEIAPLPDFYDKVTSSGVPLVKIGRTYGSYLLISPITTCEFLTQNLPCKYCDLESKKGRNKTVSEVLETIKAAVEENLAEFVCLNVGYTISEDGGISLLLPYIEAIKENFDTLICIQAQPPKIDDWIDITYASGVDSIAYNLEVFDPKLFKLVAPGKDALVGRERYFEALNRAAKIFPSGAVVSNLIVGLEPPASTIKGIDFLTSMGVIPTLPIFRSAPGVDFKSFIPLSPEAIAPIFLHLQEALNKNKLSTSWISHFNLVVNAIDGHFFGSQAPLKKRWLKMFTSKRGNKLALNIRRRLRVKTAKDDEPSGI